MSRHSRAPKVEHTPAGRRLLIVTWEISSPVSAEKAAALAQRWADGQFGEGWPAPARVEITPAPDPTDPACRALAERRQAAGLTQGELARHAGTTATVVGCIEAGRMSPYSEAADAMRRALDALEAGR